MAYNPYAISGSILQGLETEAAKQTKQEAADIAVGGQKQKMVGEYEKDIEEAQKKAEEALRKKAKKKKGLGFLGSLISFINPLAGAMFGGLTAASEGKRYGKHAYKQAQLAEKYAKDIDPRWQKTFLGKGARSYLSEAGKGYGDIVRQARKAKKETGSFGGMLKTGLASGLTSWATGKALQGIGDKFKAAKDVKAGKLIDMPSDVGFKPGQIQPLTPEGLPMKLPKTMNIADLATKHGISKDVMEKIAGAKNPQIRALLESIMGAGKDFGTGEAGFGKESTDILSGLLGMIQGSEDVYKR